MNEASDLRPITLINGFLKIGEALFASRIESGLNEMGFFVDNQFGFREKYSTFDTIENIVQNVKKAKNYRFGLLIALDFSGASLTAIVLAFKLLDYRIDCMNHLNF